MHVAWFNIKHCSEMTTLFALSARFCFVRSANNTFADATFSQTSERCRTRKMVNTWNDVVLILSVLIRTFWLDHHLTYLQQFLKRRLLRTIMPNVLYFSNIFSLFGLSSIILSFRRDTPNANAIENTKSFSSNSVTRFGTNFATLATILKSLAKFWQFFSYLAKCWPYFGKLETLLG